MLIGEAFGKDVEGENGDEFVPRDVVQFTDLPSNFDADSDVLVGFF